MTTLMNTQVIQIEQQQNYDSIAKQQYQSSINRNILKLQLHQLSNKQNGSTAIIMIQTISMILNSIISHLVPFYDSFSPFNDSLRSLVNKQFKLIDYKRYIQMKLLIIVILISLISASYFNFNQKGEVSAGETTVIPGHGYSSDTQQVSPLQCYQVKVSNITHTSSIVQFDAGMEFSDLENTFKIQVSSKFKYFLFSASLSTSFMRAIQKTDLTMSVNYYSMIQGDVPLDVGYGEASVLTETGKSVYQNGSNPDFGIICGDQIINEYKVGSMLIMSLNLEFKSLSDKKIFQLHAGASFGSFASISMYIQNIATTYKISGKIVIHGYQQGGDPSKLSTILNEKCGSHYCAASCNMTNMASCISAVDGLIAYAVNDYPKQVSFADNLGLSAYPMGFANILNIRLIGLKVPATYVTDNVTEARIALANSIFQHEYYIDRFQNIFTGYPVQMDQNSAFYLKIKSQHDKAIENIKLLQDQRNGGIMCYNDPQNCVKISKDIMASLSKLDTANWAWMDWIKKKVLVMDAMFYRHGDASTAYSPIIVGGSPYRLKTLNNFSFDPNQKLFFSMDTNDQVNHNNGFYTPSPLPTADQGNSYSGNLIHVSDHGIKRVQARSFISPDNQFYFFRYNSTSVEGAQRAQKALQFE